MAQSLWKTWACQRLLGIDLAAKLFHNSGAVVGKMRAKMR
jgi:hypothetical protein